MRMESKQFKSFVVLVLVSMLIVYLTFSRRIDLHTLQPTFSHNLSRRIDPCHGNYYLCRFRDALTKSMWYNRQVHLQGHIHNFSSITQFKTNFFRNPRLELAKTQRTDFKNRFEFIGQKNALMFKVRASLEKKFPQSWYEQNMCNGEPNKTELVRICSLNSKAYVKYATSPKELSGSGWPINIIFQVQETVFPKIPITVPYSDIYATVSTSATIASCTTESYLDLGNVSKYLISCPIVDDNFTVVIKSSFNTGSKYQSKCKKPDKRNHVIQKYTKADFDTLSIPDRKQISALAVCLSLTTKHFPGFWMKRNNIWHWSTYNCYFPFSLDSELVKCLTKTQLIMFGDSHMEYRNDALKKDFHWNTIFEFVTVPSHLLHELSKLSVTQPTVVIMNSGHWSFSFLEPLSYISDMTEIFRLIRVLKDSTDMLKFIWIESSAISYIRPVHKRFCENNIIAAMNNIVNWNMGKIGVPVVKAFDISVPMEFATRDTTHYYELLGQDVISNKKKISVGGAINSVLFNTICSQS